MAKTNYLAMLTEEQIQAVVNRTIQAAHTDNMVVEQFLITKNYEPDSIRVRYLNIKSQNTYTETFTQYGMPNDKNTSLYTYSFITELASELPEEVRGQYLDDTWDTLKQYFLSDLDASVTDLEKRKKIEIGTIKGKMESELQKLEEQYSDKERQYKRFINDRMAVARDNIQHIRKGVLGVNSTNKLDEVTPSDSIAKIEEILSGKDAEEIGDILDYLKEKYNNDSNPVVANVVPYEGEPDYNPEDNVEDCIDNWSF